MNEKQIEELKKDLMEKHKTALQIARETAEAEAREAQRAQSAFDNSKKRMEYLFNNMLLYISNLVNERDFIDALKSIGFTKNEIREINALYSFILD